MIELKIGDKFVVRSTPLEATVKNKWNVRMYYYLGKTLKVHEVRQHDEGIYYVAENVMFGWHPSNGHIDWEATKKLHEVGKTYEWHEAIKMALEGKIMNDLKTGVYIAEKNGEVRVSNEPTFEKHLKIGVTNRLLESKFVEYIKPITLTEDEKTILRNLPVKYKWLARDKDNFLYLFSIKPTKIKCWKVYDEVKNMTTLEVFNHLFQQIKWEDKEPCLIADLIK